MKMIRKLMLLAVTCGLVGVASAADQMVELVVGETVSVASPTSVTRNYYYKFVLGTGASTYVSSTKTSATQNSSSARQVTAEFTGRAFTPGYATITLQQSSKSNKSFTTLDTFTVYVAQAVSRSFALNAGMQTVATPTITTAAAWNCRVVSGADVVSAAMDNTGSARTRNVQITPLKTGQAIIEVRSGSATADGGSGRVLARKRPVMI